MPAIERVAQQRALTVERDVVAEVPPQSERDRREVEARRCRPGGTRSPRSGRRRLCRGGGCLRHRGGTVARRSCVQAIGGGGDRAGRDRRARTVGRARRPDVVKGAPGKCSRNTVCIVWPLPGVATRTRATSEGGIPWPTSPRCRSSSTRGPASSTAPTSSGIAACCISCTTPSRPSRLASPTSCSSRRRWSRPACRSC